MTALLASAPARAQDGRQLESIEVQSLPGDRIELRLRMNGAAPEPLSFTINDPARIAVDLPDTGLALDARRQDVNIGAVTTVLAAEGNGRTRVVFNLNAMTAYTTRVEGNSVVVEIGAGQSAQPTFAAQPQNSAAPAVSSGERAISRVDFRRAPDGAGRIIVDLTDASTQLTYARKAGELSSSFPIQTCRTICCCGAMSPTLRLRSQPSIRCATTTMP
jgi:type IV pilus assembly protein PilQ